MENKLPAHITNEKDLEYYEAFLQDTKNSNSSAKNMPVPSYPRGNNQMQNRGRITGNNISSPDMLHSFLTNHIGKLAKIEFLIGNKVETKTGILFNIGKEYIVLKPFKSNATIVCDIKTIKFITVIHDNDIRKLSGK